MPDTRRFFEKKRFILPGTALGLVGVLIALGANGSPGGADEAKAKAAAEAKAAADAKAAAPVPQAPAPLAGTPAGLRDYANCADLNGDYPHGVGRSGAVDKVSGGGAGVTTFTRNDELYALNSESDRDRDGIACEQR